MQCCWWHTAPVSQQKEISWVFRHTIDIIVQPFLRFHFHCSLNVYFTHWVAGEKNSSNHLCKQNMSFLFSISTLFTLFYLQHGHTWQKKMRTLCHFKIKEKWNFIKQEKKHKLVNIHVTFKGREEEEERSVKTPDYTRKLRVKKQTRTNGTRKYTAEDRTKKSIQADEKQTVTETDFRASTVTYKRIRMDMSRYLTIWAITTLILK